MSAKLFQKEINSIPVNIFHLEDDEDWFEIVIDNVLENFSVPYRFHKSKDVPTLLKKLRQYPYLSILIVDLNLENPTADNFEGLGWLLKNRSALNNNRVEVFVLSGNLMALSSNLLIYNGITRNHVFNKDLFDGKKFSKALDVATQRILYAFAERWGVPSMNSICAIDARLIDTNIIDDIYQIQLRKQYTLDISIISLGLIEEYPFLIGKALSVYAYCVDAEVFPEIQYLKIPPPYTLGSIQFELTFESNTSSSIRQLYIVVNYDNNQLRIFEFKVRLEANKMRMGVLDSNVLLEYV